MRVRTLLGLMALAAAGALSCKSGPSPAEQAAATGRAAQYSRIAIVCAPGQGADPSYAEPMILQVRAMAATRLSFLQTVDCLTGVAVDTSAVPPRVTLGEKAASYDGALALVYTYGNGHVLLDMYLLDAKTGALAWTHRLDTKDADIRGRLLKDAYWTPTIVKQQCYGHK